MVLLSSMSKTQAVPSSSSLRLKGRTLTATLILSDAILLSEIVQSSCHCKCYTIATALIFSPELLPDRALI